MAKKAIALAATVAVAAIALSGCSSSGSAANSITGKPTGTITVLTQRTDLVSDGTFKKYAAEFNKAYPDVTVKFEGVNDYENAIKTRLNGTKYGDVLAIPAAVKPSQLAQFFEPLGKTTDYSGKYRYTAQASYGGTQYGIVSGGNANGIVYNKKVWEKAGITKLPTTETEWLDDLKLIKSKTDAIPLYTNYKDGWPLSQGMGSLGAITDDPDAAIHMAENPKPWTEGTDIYAIDSLLFDSVHDKLTEPDPLSTDWEGSKTQLGAGKIGAMVLGSWAVSQMQAAAVKAGASADDIGYMAFPANVKGVQYATNAGDYAYGISKHSTAKAAAMAWITWFTEKSDYTKSQGMVSTLKDSPLPANLTGLSDAGVKLIEPAAAPKGKESLLSDVANQAQIDLYGQVYRQKLVDIARGAADGTKDGYFAELNTKWSAAVKQLVK
ncbi:ABC transporter substrate-binding protein [Microbacterium sp. 22242]|uniref:ABC transporter substrate-binding protein n=1 Tax=Microbacterium sp. 22242 TaxID=3453896 RepID=UPI003F843F26